MPSQKRFINEFNKIENEIKDIKQNINNILLLIQEYNKEIKKINNPLYKKDIDLKDYINIENDFI